MDPSHLYSDIRLFLFRHKIPPTKFGRLALKDPRFVDDLRMGRNPRQATIDKCMKFMQEYKDDQ